MVNLDLQPKTIVFFDGVCNLCNGSVQFLIKHDKKKIFHFATLQSEIGKEALKNAKVSGNFHNSVLLYDRGKYYNRSGAAIQALRLLGGPWQLFRIFLLVPPFIRNMVYDTIARNRYKWFGKSQECMVPTPDLISRFINE